jgi:hypothetical protein
VSRGKASLLAYQFEVTINETQIVTLNAPSLSSSFFGVTYDTPNGNLPAKYKNQILVFEGGPAVPADAYPVGSAAAGQDGTYVFPDSGKTFASIPYVCAYSVGPFTKASGMENYPNIAATIFLPGGVGGTAPPVPMSSSLGIQTAQSPFITWSFTLPPGTNPTANGAWIGLWLGTMVPYGRRPDGFAPVYGTDNAGLSPMPYHVTALTQYVGALFTSGYNADVTQLQLTAIAAVLLFTTGPAQKT